METVRKTIIFLIDASESMIDNEQIKLVKGAVLGLLTKAYQKRYRAGVVVFRDTKAEIILPPTTSINRARHELQGIAAGGGTPLADGLQKVLRLIRSERIRHPNDLPQMILLTDGKPSIKIDQDKDIRQEVLSLASNFPLENIPSTVLTTSDPCEIIREIAETLKAPLHKITDVIHK